MRMPQTSSAPSRMPTYCVTSNQLLLRCCEPRLAILACAVARRSICPACRDARTCRACLQAASTSLRARAGQRSFGYWSRAKPSDPALRKYMRNVARLQAAKGRRYLTDVARRIGGNPFYRSPFRLGTKGRGVRRSADLPDPRWQGRRFRAMPWPKPTETMVAGDP